MQFDHLYIKEKTKQLNNYSNMASNPNSILKKLLPHACAIVCFFVITMVYFSPLLEGKVLPQGDTRQFAGMSHELSDYYEKKGVASVWTGSMFSGMPAYQIGVWGSNPNLLDYIEAPFKALGSSTAGAVFAGMIMAYILFSVMGFGVIPSCIGAIAYSFSSYNIIILEAGHVTKAWSIAYMPLIVASLLVMFRKKHILGGLLMAIGLALQVKNNHLQITYYTGILCLIIYAGYIINILKQKDFKALGKTTGILAFAVTIAVLCNLSNFYSNYEMAQESIRGTSELSQPTTSEKQSSGLDKEYAFAWSYGKAETLSLLIPNIHGGESGGSLDKNSNLYKQFLANGIQTNGKDIPQVATYWGDQPFTSGPVYFGAIVCFLFVLGMIIIRSNIKWVLLFSTVFFIFLSWGSNFEAFNDLFFYHFPFYNKFRAVSTALVIPALTMLIVAVWGISEFISKKIDEKKLLKALYISAGVTGGLCLFFWLLPDFFFNFVSETDTQWKAQVPEWYYNALLLDRKALLSADALRSLIFIVLAGGVLWGSLKIKSIKPSQSNLVLGAIFILVLVDLWNIDRRYLNDDKYQTKQTYTSQLFPQSIADKAILQDKSPSYRVLNLNNPFNESGTSYYHKSIGGYHAAKLKRYQELIDYRITPEMGTIINSFQSQNLDSIIGSFKNLTALNMLNAKYIIYNPEQPPLENPYALGNAWFASNFWIVETADNEIAALNSINPRHDAVVNKKYENELSGFTIQPDSTAVISMTTYKPDVITYKSNSNSEQLAVFSEVYYANGWEAYIDGKPAPHFLANWTLRAMRIPAGEHEIEFKFVPHTYYATRTVSRISSGLLILMLVGGIVMSIRKKKETI